jgi:hypothetical protein
MMSHGDFTEDTKVGATISKRDTRVPLAKLNRFNLTRLTKRLHCDNEQALLDFICYLGMIITGAPCTCKIPSQSPRPKAAGRKTACREATATWQGDRGAILAGDAVSPPWPQHIIAQK